MIDVAAISNLCRCVACFVPEIIFGLPVFFEVGPRALVRWAAFPTLVLCGEKTCVENRLFSECDKFLVGFLLSHEVCEDCAVPDLLYEEEYIVRGVPWAAHAFVIFGNVMR